MTRKSKVLQRINELKIQNSSPQQYEKSAILFLFGLIASLLTITINLLVNMFI